MAFLIIDDSEELPMPLPDQTGDGEGGRLLYRRMPSGEVRERRMRAGLTGPREQWDAEKREKYEDDLIRFGFRRAVGVKVRRGDSIEDIQVTADHVLRMGPALREMLTRFIEGEIIATEKKEGAPQTSADADKAEVVLPNS